MSRRPHILIKYAQLFHRRTLVTLGFVVSPRKRGNCWCRPNSAVSDGNRLSRLRGGCLGSLQFNFGSTRAKSSGYFVECVIAGFFFSLNALQKQLRSWFYRQKQNAHPPLNPELYHSIQYVIQFSLSAAHTLDFAEECVITQAYSIL